LHPVDPVTLRTMEQSLANLVSAGLLGALRI
jgi:hypothetical protein